MGLSLAFTANICTGLFRTDLFLPRTEIPAMSLFIEVPPIVNFCSTRVDNLQQLMDMGLYVGDLNAYDTSRDYVFNGLQRASNLEYLIDQVLFWYTTNLHSIMLLKLKVATIPHRSPLLQLIEGQISISRHTTLTCLLSLFLRVSQWPSFLFHTLFLQFLSL